MALDVRPLVSNQFPRVITGKSRYVGDRKNLVPRETEKIQGMLIILVDSKRSPPDRSLCNRVLTRFSHSIQHPHRAQQSETARMLCRHRGVFATKQFAMQNRSAS